MSAENARTGAAAGDAGAASHDSEEKDVKIPVEDANEVDEAAEAANAEAAAEAEEQEAQAWASAEADDDDGDGMTEEEMVEAAIRAGEQAADDDFKVKFEKAQQELTEARKKLSEAEDKAKDAAERTSRLQADWENFRRRTAKERLEERDRATEKLIGSLLPVVDDMERAIEHARTQELDDTAKQFVDGVDAVRAKLMGIFEHEGVEAIDPAGEAFDPNVHQAVGRVEDASKYDETVNDVYQKGYRMAGKVLRPAMVTVTYGGEKRPAEESKNDSAE